MKKPRLIFKADIKRQKLIGNAKRLIRFETASDKGSKCE